VREFELLRAVYRQNESLPSFVTVPPGDDMAELRLPAGAGRLLVAVDQVIAGRHVRHDEDPKLIGRKAVARNVSDIAAMAAAPLASVVACCLPRDWDEPRALSLFAGLRESAAAWNCPLVGGDLALGGPGDPLTVSVTVLATPRGRAITRRGSRDGDGVFVTGSLGGSLAPGGGGRHLTFEPRLPESHELLATLGDRLHAMIDLSDGLGRDAGHLLEDPDAAGLAIELDAAALPVHPGCDWRSALGDGEDYELLFTAAGPVPARLGATPVARVGSVRARRDGEPSLSLRLEGRLVDVSGLGWEHANSEGKSR
jgi:thiamine-monophosphate kinase